MECFLTQKIYVGNLSFSSTEEDIRKLFSSYGEVLSVVLPSDRETGRPRGFGFVEMSEADSARAISAVNGMEFGGRTLRVNQAQEREASRGFGGGGGGSGGGGGGARRGGFGGGRR